MLSPRCKKLPDPVLTGRFCNFVCVWGGGIRAFKFLTINWDVVVCQQDVPHYALSRWLGLQLHVFQLNKSKLMCGDENIFRNTRWPSLC